MISAVFQKAMRQGELVNGRPKPRFDAEEQLPVDYI